MGNRALVVIDVQRAVVEETDPNYETEALLGRLDGLIQSARAAGVPVLYVQHDGGEGDALAHGAPGWELHPMISPLPGEVVVEKRTPDTFESTNLQALLTEQGISDLVICGLQTDCCVDATTRGAASRGYQVTLVADGHSTHAFGEPATQVIAQYNQSLSEGGFATLKPAAEIRW